MPVQDIKLVVGQGFLQQCNDCANYILIVSNKENRAGVKFSSFG